MPAIIVRTLPACLLAVGWILYLAAAPAIAASFAQRFGSKLDSLANGKFPDPAIFIHHRIREVLVLSTLAFVLFLAWRWLSRFTRNTPSFRPANGLICGALVFLLVNVMTWAAGNTVVFWTLFYNRERVDNTAQFHIKKILLGETQDRRRIILMGNSQANRSIDEKAINRVLGARVWSTELTQPGARGFDLFTIARNIPFRKGDLVVFYVSEISFYGEGSGISAANFMGIRELLPAWRFGASGHLRTDAVLNGLLGQVFPLLRFNSSLSPRILGGATVDAKQHAANIAAPADLETQAREWAPKLKIGGGSQFEQAAFSAMVDDLAAQGCQVLLIHGNLHPALESRMSPEVRRHFSTFVESQCRRHPSTVAILGKEDVMPTTGGDFTDLVHFTDAAQERFTKGLTDLLGSWQASGIPAFSGAGAN